MTYRGHIRNGVVVLDVDANLPDGTAVSVEPLHASVLPAGSPSAVLEVVGTWQGDRAEMDRLLEELRQDKWAEVEADQRR